MLDENQLRLTIFIGVLALMATLEALFPKKERTQSRQSRWTTNLSLVVINSVVLRLLGPITAVLAAEYAHENGWGLLNLMPIELPFIVQIALGVALLDLAIYAQHVASHHIPVLWRFHKVHHADRDIDVTTGIRFHPIEAALSMVYKCGIILLLGPLALSVVIFEIVLNASAMFNHANMKLPKRFDAILRLFFVTPDMHRVHHSVIPAETNSNYGFFLPFWDRLFKTYIDQPSKGHDGMTIGLNQFQSDNPSKLPWVITVPFKNKKL
ncbi:sterol desaturase family protein [Leucothrix arctica]|uniref:Fatty acid hydroxylase n=1 Tax=Leucothrix arctica TaxID=1481894 RepID=A0A317CAU8_9GAMM|nr:sterol desaturase family protein [Leucothrix arctica]PWQ95668.1 fatty acid hydroxylase [Leucothrix arctica]